MQPLPALPPREKKRATGVLLTVALLDRLDVIAEQEGRSRNEVIEHLLRYASNQHAAARKKALTRP